MVVLNKGYRNPIGFRWGGKVPKKWWFMLYFRYGNMEIKEQIKDIVKTEYNFWTDGYFAVSVGNVSEEMLKKIYRKLGLRKRVTEDVKGI